jgi:hypothetical protein
VFTIDRGCGKCHGTTANVEYKGDNIWHISNNTGDMTISKEDWALINGTIHEYYHGED